MGSGLRRLFGVSAFLAACPALLGSQPAANNKAPPVNPEVVQLKLNGVHAVKQAELLMSIATDESHCNSFVLVPICFISKAKYFYKRKYLDHAELKRDVVRIKVFYWKRGFREAQVDTLVADRGKNEVAVTFNIVEGPPTRATRTPWSIPRSRSIQPRAPGRSGSTSSRNGRQPSARF